MNSMTGYGENHLSKNGISISVKILSYNHKSIDIRVNIPENMASLKGKLRKCLSTQISRGSINVTVSLELESDVLAENIHINKPLMRKIIKDLKDLALECNIEPNIDMSNILLLPGLIKESEIIDGVNYEKVSDLIMLTFKDALMKLVQLRGEEGSAIKIDLLDRKEILSGFLDKIRTLSSDVPRLYQKKLKERISELLNDKIILEDSALEREVAMFADKADISEEIIRLNLHLARISKFFEEKGSIGRKIDFLLQEMNREVNTIGSKCNHSEISSLVVEFKAELERIREQIQNIE